MKQDYPSKLYYSISEVASITDVKAHVLRYWETEFPTLKPKKTRNLSRRYRQADIEEILAIKELLYVEGFKIAGARKVRKQARKAGSTPKPEVAPQMALGFDAMDDKAKLAFIKDELRTILKAVRDLDPTRDENASEEPLKEMEDKG